MDEDEWEAFFSIAGAFVSVLGAATAAGLTMGLMSLDSLDLLVIAESDPDDCANEHERLELENEKQNANLLLPLIDDHHRLLVTLLLINSLCAEALPIFLDELVPSSIAVLLGVLFLLVFGEIMPSAIFTGPAGMKTSARLAPLVRTFLLVLAPIAIPVGKFLDWWVGDEEDKVYNRSELLALLRIHSGKSAGKLLTVKQSRMMQGAMDLMHVTAAEVMSPIDKMFMLSTEMELNLSLMAEIVGKGYSRIPVYEKTNRNRIKGILLTKSLAVVNPADRIPVGNLFARPCGCVSPDTHLYEVLAVMRATRSHMCLVTDEPIKLSKFMQRTAGAFIPSGGAEGGVLGSNPLTKTSAQALKETTWKVLGCVSLHDIVACIVAGDIADEYSARRQPKLRHLVSPEHSDFSDNEDEETPRRPKSGTESSTQGLNGTEQHIEFKSKFAKEKVMQWVERARLTTKLHHQQLEQQKQMAMNKTEATPLVSTGSASSLTGPAAQTLEPDHRAKSSAVARRLLSSWLLRRAAPVTVTRAEVASTLQQVAGTQHVAAPASLVIRHQLSSRSIKSAPSLHSVASNGSDVYVASGKNIFRQPESDDEV